MMQIPRKMAHGERLTAELYNNLLDYVRRITPIAGANTRISFSLGGAKIDTSPTIVEDSSPKPFQVRYHDDQWEIFLPTGCLSVGSTCTPINKKASESNSHDDDKEGWYVFRVNEVDGDPDTDGEGDETVSYRKFSVIVHGKPSAKVSGVDEVSSPARHLMSVTSRRIYSNTSNKPQDDDTDFVGYEGDEFSNVVAIVRIEGAGDNASRQISQIVNSSIAVSQRNKSRNYDLVWYFKVENNFGVKVDHVHCVRNEATIAGVSVVGESYIDVTSAEDSIWVKLETQNIGGYVMTNAANVISVLTDLSSTTQAEEFAAYVKIYSIKKKCVVADLRDALNSYLFYR